MGRAHVSTHQPVAGRYRLVEIIHRETNHLCWYADDLGTGRPCLVTQVALPGDPGEAVRHAPSHVLRATGMMARLCPGRIAAVVDSVHENGFLWTAAAWVDGTPLGELLAEQGSFTFARAARIGLELLDVLDAAHSAGVTHGELGPGQVFVRETGPVVVTGFGLAGTVPALRLTAPSYAAPEQARGEGAGPEADLWALGALLHTMVEGRPPFRDRGRAEATLKGVDRLPLRAPLRAGPLTPVVQGLLRKDAAERPTGRVVREALGRVLAEENPGTAPEAVPGRLRLRGAYPAVLRDLGRAGRRRTAVLGTALAVVTVAVVVLTAATRGLPGTDSGSAADTPSAPPASAAAPAAPQAPGASGDPGDRDDRDEPTPAPTTPAPSGTGDLPPGYGLLSAPEGFSVALPENFERLDTSRVSDLAYRITFGPEDGTRTLAITYSERVGTDPVAVWRDDVEPPLERTAGYERIGAIRATTYQGSEAADMEWLSADDGARTRTFGRGFLLGGGRGFSLRWTAPAADWAKSANQEALRTFLRTFRPSSGRG
ncbi:serine/threonine protein kinase [Streptomyces hirsutus]|uniref:non-specific serine/threonine protein kinase n=1 Tax=Streptomyces hirsutus TaxID=35620 RepID=A0ABZ1GJ83_9ACTN|nr:serine/threonine-protein kinase [Streptomyces hirsutus]WSD04793.1 serine/threonine protein kinase [Streptomyces hirsutus]WTD21816.1 serine/threonine protein kinase [Streptomyces hirsutus]WTD79200.1 serine/threonine protein kinase [Streptomyces sp. NBC_01635]